MEFKSDNFDKEFSLNREKKTKTGGRGKLPPWLMILAGVAAISGAVAARQPAVHKTTNSTKAPMSVSASQSVSGDRAVYTGLNDSQADAQELEARFASQGNQTETLVLVPDAAEPSDPVLTPTAGAENVLVFAPENEKAALEGSDKPSETISSPAGDPSAADETGTAPAAETGTASAAEDKPAVVWMNDKAYSVTLNPNEKPAASAADSSSSSNASSVPVTVFDENGEPLKQPQVSVFEVEGRSYELQLEELNSEEIPAENTSPIVWLDEIPLQVSISADTPAAGSENTGEQTETPIEVSLNPLPAEQTAALQQERFGTPLKPTAEADPFPVETEEPAPTATEEPQEENWFASFFSNIFGSDPTEVPTPQVTVIAITPTPTIVLPTATPLIVRMVPTAEAQGPVRLDGEKVTENEVEAVENKESDLVDPALTEDEITEKPTDVSKPSSDGSAETAPTKPAPARIDPVVVESFDESNKEQKPAVQPTPEELPHTGGAESWNIPSLIVMLAGLLLVIIGVRRLRTKE